MRQQLLRGEFRTIPFHEGRGGARGSLLRGIVMEKVFDSRQHFAGRVVGLRNPYREP